MATSTHPPATFDDLSRVEGKAELINGEIVPLMASGKYPNRVAFKIAMRLELYVEQLGVGLTYTDGMGYAIDPPLTSGRQSFSPDVSYAIDSSPNESMRFIEGAPRFAVEVRSEHDHDGPAADRAIAAKRVDYFEAGTLVVWDVNTVTKTVSVYRKPGMEPDAVYGAGMMAEAEPAVPGWRCPVDAFFAA